MKPVAEWLEVLDAYAAFPRLSAGASLKHVNRADRDVVAIGVFPPP